MGHTDRLWLNWIFGWSGDLHRLYYEVRIAGISSKSSSSRSSRWRGGELEVENWWRIGGGELDLDTIRILQRIIEDRTANGTIKDLARNHLTNHHIMVV